jgi:hypothetical protein
MLPDLDSNQDRQNQNLQYYHYTIGQYIKNLFFVTPQGLEPWTY